MKINCHRALGTTVGNLRAAGPRLNEPMAVRTLKVFVRWKLLEGSHGPHRQYSASFAFVE